MNESNENKDTLNPPVPSQDVPDTGKKGDKGKKKEEAEDTVPVPRATLEKLLDRVEKLEKDNEILKEVQDKSKLQRVSELRAAGKLVKNVNLNVLMGKIIVGWRKVKDDVYLDEQNRIHEEQVIEVIFEDKSKKELDYRSFSRLNSKLKGEVIAEKKDRDGNTNFTVLLPDGKEIDIDIKFVN